MAVVFVLGFWSVFFPQAERSVFGRVPILDEIYYLDRAAAPPNALAEPNFMSPLYPRLIALGGGAPAAPGVRIFAPAELRGIRLVQWACWLGIVVLLRVLAGRQLAPMVAPGWRRLLVSWLPPMLFALYRPAAVYAVSILLDVPLALLVTVFLALLVAGNRHERLRAGLLRAAGLGVVVGAAALLRGTALLLLPLGMAAAARHGRSWKLRLVCAGLAMCAALAVMTPAIVHNTRAAGRMVGPALNGGVNFYIGNGPQANGFYAAVVPGSWLHDPAGRVFLAQRFDRPEVTLAEADGLWMDAAVDHVRHHPWRTAALWFKKVWLHLQGWEIDQLTTMDGWTRAVPALRVLIVPYALLAFLGLVGLAGLRRGTPADSPWRWWGGTFAVLLAGQSVFFVVSRYRLTLVPVLALLGGLAVARMLSAGRPAWRHGLLWVAAAALIVPWGLGAVRQEWSVLAKANEGMRWAQLGAEGDDAALATAETLYREAVAGGSGGPAAWLGLALVLHERGDRAGSEQVLIEGARAVPGNLDIQKILINQWLDQKRRDEAFSRILQVLREHPHDADLLHQAAVLYEQAGQREDALRTARDLLRRHPKSPRGYVDLGVLLARSGDLEGAAAVFRQGLLAVPGDSDLRVNLDKVSEDLEK